MVQHLRETPVAEAMCRPLYGPCLATTLNPFVSAAVRVGRRSLRYSLHLLKVDAAEHCRLVRALWRSARLRACWSVRDGKWPRQQAALSDKVVQSLIASGAKMAEEFPHQPL